MLITKKKIIQDLKALGIQEGDLLFPSVDLFQTGYFNRSAKQTLIDWVEIFDTLLGPTGTFILPSYSPTFFRFNKDSKIVFTKSSKFSSGSLSRAFFEHSQIIRSRHPTQSCIGRGPLAEEILNDHGPESTSYFPYGEIIKLKGKNLMIGTHHSQSPMSFHYAQEVLGHTQSHPFAKLFQTYYYDKGFLKLFTRNDYGGCTAGVPKTLDLHIRGNACKLGPVGNAEAAIFDTEKSFNILKKVLINQPSLIRCDNKLCISCYGRYKYNGFGVIPFYIRKAANLLKKIIK